MIRRMVLPLVGVLIAMGACLTAAEPPAGPAPSSGPARSAQSAPVSSRYTTGPKSYDGTGKFYMGREISLVMGHMGAAWLERPEREREEKPDLLVDSMRLEPDDVVADIGAGTGYLSFRMAKVVTRGKVLAVDIQPEMLERIETRAKATGAANVVPVQGEIDDPGLPAGEVDAVLMVDAYHEFSHPYEMMVGVVKGLRVGGRVFLVEYRAEDPRIPIKPLHKMRQEQAKKEMAAVGLEWVETQEVLPQQHIMIFQKPGRRAAGAETSD